MVRYKQSVLIQTNLSTPQPQPATDGSKSLRIWLLSCLNSTSYKYIDAFNCNSNCVNNHQHAATAVATNLVTSGQQEDFSMPSSPYLYLDKFHHNFRSVHRWKWYCYSILFPSLIPFSIMQIEKNSIHRFIETARC